MSNLHDDVAKVLDMVEKTEGYLTEMAPKGGVKITSPSGASAVFHRQPDNPKTFQNMMTRLRRDLDWTKKRYTQQAEKERQERVAQHDAQHAAVLEKLEKKRRVAEAVDEIIGEMHYSSWLLSEAVRELAIAHGRRANYQKLPGWHWQGDLFHLARSLWPDLPDARMHPEIARLQTTLIPHMKENGVLVLVKPHPGAKSTWWVPDEEAVVEEAPYEEPPAPEEQSTPIVEHPKEPSLMKIFHCGGPTEIPGQMCPFVDYSEASLNVHQSKSRNGQPHPFEKVWECPHADVNDSEGKRPCPVKRGTVTSMKQHIQKMHGDHRHRCSHCLEPFDSLGAVRMHGAKEHSTSAVVKGSIVKTVEVQPAPVPEVTFREPEAAPVVALPVPAAVNGNISLTDPEGMAVAIAKMLTDYASKTAENAALRAENATLSANNAALTADNAAMRESLDTIKKAMGALV